MRTYLSLFSPSDKEHRLVRMAEGEAPEPDMGPDKGPEAYKPVEQPTDIETPKSVEDATQDVTNGVDAVINDAATAANAAWDTVKDVADDVVNSAAVQASAEQLRKYFSVPQTPEEPVVRPEDISNEEGQGILPSTEQQAETPETSSEQPADVLKSTRENNETELKSWEGILRGNLDTRGYENTKLNREPGTNTFTISFGNGAGGEMGAKLQEFAKAHGLQPIEITENGNVVGYTVTITGYETEFGFTGPDYDRKKEEKIPGDTPQTETPTPTPEPTKGEGAGAGSGEVAEEKQEVPSGSPEKAGEGSGEAGEGSGEGSGEVTEETQEVPSGSPEKAGEGSGEAAEEAAEEVTEDADARSERIEEETKKALEELDKEYGKLPEEEKTSTDAGKRENVEDAKESTETLENQKERLRTEVLGKKPEDKKTVEEVKENKDKGIKAAEDKKNESLTPLNDLKDSQKSLITSLEEQIAAEQDKESVKEGSSDTAKIDGLRTKLEATREKLATTMKKIDVVEKEFDIAKKKLESDKKVLDDMDANTKKLAEESDKRLTALGVELKSAGDMEMGTAADDVTVTSDGSLGFSVAKVSTLIEDAMTPEQRKEAKGDNPAVVLRTVHAVLKAAKEKAKK